MTKNKVAPFYLGHGVVVVVAAAATAVCIQSQQKLSVVWNQLC